MAANRRIRQGAARSQSASCLNRLAAEAPIGYKMSALADARREFEPFLTNWQNADSDYLTCGDASRHVQM